MCILTAEAIHTLFVGVYTEPAAKLPKRKQHSLAFRETEPEVESLFVDYYLAECLAQEIGMKGKGSEPGKERQHIQSNASLSWCQFSIETQPDAVTLGHISQEAAWKEGRLSS